MYNQSSFGGRGTYRYIGTSRAQVLLLAAFLVPHVSTSHDKLDFA